MTACASPEVVDTKQMGDNKLSCMQLVAEIQEATEFERKAQKRKGCYWYECGRGGDLLASHYLHLLQCQLGDRRGEGAQRIFGEIEYEKRLQHVSRGSINQVLFELPDGLGRSIASLAVPDRVAFFREGFCALKLILRGIEYIDRC